MTFILILVTNIILFFIMDYLCQKTEFLIDKKEFSQHKRFTNSNRVPFSGGLILAINYLLFGTQEIFINYLLIFLIFIIGFFSDTQKLTSTSKRFFLQIITILIFIHFNKIIIPYIYIDIFDKFLNNSYLFSILFTSFCLLILLNGSNFIDGTNLLCSGYYLSILFVIFLVSVNQSIIINIDDFLLIFSFLIVFMFFNSFNKTYLGDGGSYLVSFIIGIYLIDFFIKNNVSPYFIALMLWYPAFENLFSILRRLIFVKNKIDNPDNLHLHHLIYFYISKKNLNNFFKTNGTGFILIFYNLIIFILGSFFLFNSKILILIIITSLILYCTIYYFFYKNFMKRKI